MNDQFTFDFNNLLKACQPKPIRIWLQILISLAIFSVAEITFFSNFRNMVVVECSLANSNTTSMSLDNCFANNHEITTCINSQYNTGSNYSLDFSISLLGLKGDKYSPLILGFVIVVYLMFMLVFQVCHYFSFNKRKRIQDILSEARIFIDGKKKYEGKLTIYFLCVGAVYVAIKVIWISYRDNQYSNIECNSQTFKVQFATTVSSSVGTLIQSSMGLIIMPLIYIGSWINYLSDIDLKNILTHLSNDSTKQFKSIRIFSVIKYNSLIDKAIDEKYAKEPFYSRFFRKNTFTFKKTSTTEISQILLDYQKTNPHEFEPVQYNEPKISIKSEENQKLIN
ncbi:hypothetical protein DICPUDRAFT_57886 [Dictyostelium purpureum]|uniref:Transmembrane protein n=1 Tax=Dictyostelium purpureum TaxID=5786 RepID=F0ZY47_DICPU|nr:uncharacterized protein DICPUDRAFT_57886 [Dictyostelium purpureum]EGC31121.1 hypothetical protein DICPUDRAFT_57886 [Dictyostelium purpureum]|eukprot:XP_003292339.1 hypothetical protein DICPUDRAFT_57886 [Dictyostelium purpureum]